MGSLTDEIMGKLKGKKPGGSPDISAETGEPADDAMEEESYGSDEEAAMQDFMDATDAAGKTSALKAFLEVCVPKIMGGAEE